ncbi:phage capsid protein [Bradyrhizobium elkanii]|uniref:Uncharacterized protein n=1 Tax=Bradyrhizobium elkanii TaxID=29448 RepID=A0A8I2C680_BRAEL|nr:phage capsid protein [Bradyrhizobium elkanii]MBP1296619.1 hypothetical protein [Bradyrhizobium elkanii]
MSRYNRFAVRFAIAFAIGIAALSLLGYDTSWAAPGALGFGLVGSIEAPNWYTIQYDQRVRHLIQSEGFLLRGTTDAPVEVKGNTLEFFFIGRAEAQPFGPTPERGKAANLGKTIKTVDMTDWQFYEEVRHGEPEKISPEYRSKIQQAGSMAMGRKFDRIIMEAMDGEAGNITTIGDGSVAITPIQISTGKAQINSLGMMSQNEFFMPVPSISWEQLKLYKIFNNRDYTAEQLLFKGKTEAVLWNGVWVFQAPDEMFTSPAANQVDTYLWNKANVGFGSNYAMQSRITYENTITAWVYNTVMSGAAKVLQPVGVKRVRVNINAALAIN